MRRVALLVVAMLVLTAGCDWPMFGASPAQLNSNVETTINASNVATLTQKWAVPNGAVLGAPIAVHGTVYDASSGVNAFDAQSGSPLWTTPLPGGGTPPSYANGLVYSASRAASGNIIAAFDAQTGHLVWSQPVVDRPGAPMIAGGLAYVATETAGCATCGPEMLYAFNAATGSLVWAQPIGPSGIAGLDVAPTIADGEVFIGSDGIMRAFDAATGAPKWSLNFGSVGVGSAAASGGLVYANVSSGPANPMIGGVYALSTTDGHIVWFNDLTMETGLTEKGVGKVAVSGGNLVVGFFAFTLHTASAGLLDLDPATGAMLWGLGNTGYFDRVSVANGVIYAGNGFGVGVLVAFALADGSPLLTINNNRNGWITIANGRIFCDDSAGTLHSYGLP